VLLLLTSVAKVVSLRGKRSRVGCVSGIRELDPMDGYFFNSDSVEQVGDAYLLLLGIAVGVSGGSKAAVIPLVAFHVRGGATLLSRHV
jgi:hypothetical protein